uniref:Membrane protein, palmitoylated 3 (MAGUK p55 subfamily member 3) n=2 Tax=Nothobranchius TaxID=28779 RepID=A0A1A8A433_NOTFU
MIEAMPIVSASTGLHETLALLTSQLHPDANHKEDLVFLRDVFSEKSISYLMKIHEKLRQYEKYSPTPVLHSASCLAEDLAEELQSGALQEDERELLLLLSTPHLKAVLSAHDIVAQKKFDPVLPPLPEDLDDDFEEESVKIVRLVKNKEPLGATIRRDEVTGAVIVARIMRGGAADRSGLVHVGDELREVNGNLITHKRPEEISQILSQSQGSITLKIIPAVAEEDKLRESRAYLRALFDYTPFEDKATPCQEAGLPFRRGDILQVVSQEDATWWQAKKVGDCNLRAALIPSTQFQERRLRYRLKMGSLPSPVPSKASTYDRTDREDCDSKGALNGKDVGENHTVPPLFILIPRSLAQCLCRFIPAFRCCRWM